MIQKNELIIVICSAFFLIATLTLILILTSNKALTEMDRATSDMLVIESVDAKTFEENESVDIEEIGVVSNEIDVDLTENIIDETDDVLIINEFNNEDQSSETEMPESESIDSEEVILEEIGQEEIEEETDISEEIEIVVIKEEQEPVLEITAIENVEPVIPITDEKTEEEQFKEEIIEVVQELADIEEELVPAEPVIEIVSVPSGPGLATAVKSEGFKVSGGYLTASESGSYLVYEVKGEYAVITFSKTMYTGIGEIFVDNRFIKSVDTINDVNEANQVKTVQVDFYGKGIVQLKIVSAIGFGQELKVQSVVVYD